MATSTWKELTAGLDDDDLAKLTAFRDYCRKLGDVDERIHTPQIAFAGKRVFASAYVKSHYLELGIELTREVTDPKPRASFATTKRFFMHRYSLRELSHFDASIKKLLKEAFETVGPGSR